jgi:hypothetical protein
MQGDLDSAQKYYSEALTIQAEIGQKTQIAFTQEYLATVLVDRGNFVEAERLARQSAESHKAEKSFHQESLALRVLAEAQLARGDAAAAKVTMDSVRLRPQTDSQDPAFAITGARIIAATGHAAGARQILDTTIATAKKKKQLATEFESRLARAEVELKFGDAGQGIARLNDLERDARAKGLPLFALRAKAAVTALR